MFVFDELRGFRQTIPAITSFQGGDYNSPWGLSQGFSYRFTMTFSDEPVHDAYLPQLAHQAVVAMLQPIIDGGLDDAAAFDSIDGVMAPVS
jgi:hypothetical protein